MPSPVQLTGGSFQDTEGNVLANGYLKFKLSQDCSVGGTNICSGVEVTVQLDGSGNARMSPPQYLWANDVLSPSPTFYRVTGYTEQGQPVWGPNNQQVIGNGGTFDLGTWIPNQVYTWTPNVIAPFPAAKTVTVPVSAAQILNLASTPIEILPGVDGVSYTPIAASLVYTPGTKGYVDPIVPSGGGGQRQWTLTGCADASTTSFSLTSVDQNVYRDTQGVGFYVGTVTGGDGSAFEGYPVNVSGFSMPGNNGTFLCVASDATDLTLCNSAAVSETHAGTAIIGTTVYTGTITGGDGNAYANDYFFINGFTNPANNGVFQCVASTATTLTLVNVAGVAETASAVATQGGQSFALNVPLAAPISGSQSVQYPFEGEVPVFNGFLQPFVMAICGTLTPQVTSTQQNSIASVPRASAPGQPVTFILWGYSNLQATPTGPTALTDGDGTLSLTLQYLQVSAE